MAREIKETPILNFKQSKKFLKEIENVKKLNIEEKQKIQESYLKIKSICTF